MNSDFTREELSEAKDEFVKMLPIIPLLLTIAGAFKLYFHYDSYGIKIFNFIEIQEILLLFLDEIYAAVFSIIFIQLLAIFPVNEAEFFIFGQPTATSSNTRRLFYGLFTKPGGILVAILLTNIVKMTENEIILVIGFFSLIFFVGVNLLNQGVRMQRAINTRLNSISAAISRFYLWFFLGLVGYTFFTICRESVFMNNQRYEQNDGLGAYIVTEKQTVDLSRDNLLIGRTKNYVFIYSKIDKCTQVLPVSEIKDSYFRKK